MSFLKKLYCTYKHLLIKYPYKVQTIQVVGLLGFGDVIAQKVDRRVNTYNVDRTIKFMSAGIIIGPAIHAWFTILEKLYGRSKHIKTAMKKVATDQLIFAPIFIAVVIVYVNLLNGKDENYIKQVLKNDYPRMLRDNYLIWPAAQLINFSLIPFNYRLLFLQSLGVLWNVYLAWRIGSMSNIGNNSQ